MTFYRQIHTKIWTDRWFFDLSSDVKLLFIYLFGNERANLTGLYEIPLPRIACDTHLELEVVREGLASFEQAGRVVYRDGWVFVVNLLAYNVSNAGSPKIQQHLRTMLEAVPDMPLKEQWLARYGELLGESPTADTATGDSPGSVPPTGNSPALVSPGRESPGQETVAHETRGGPAAPSPRCAVVDAVSADRPVRGGPVPDRLDRVRGCTTVDRNASQNRLETVSIHDPTEQEQDLDPDPDQDPYPDPDTFDPEEGKTESAGADGGRPPSGAGVGERSERASLREADPAPARFTDWEAKLRDSTNRPVTLQAMFEVLYPGRDPPGYGYLGRVGRAVGGAGRLAELLWQHSTRPPTGDVLAYILAVVQRERQRFVSKPAEPAGFAGIREWMRQEGMEWQPEIPSLTVS
jgi:hypothetical protein